ncbi:hypothetical protein Q766_16740 [Flavobacterium subsaxonicum WB 4.1-42 = DSM 21790]|uniref:Uncharacterized protein n=1 Tax=Flavobacterium subsaxonicum WB 4.1-42 = DSM 21790 TaxID=1121898 RepID=A0A0A2MGA5_9FLAO|nr:hypothetical protein Q766_16740 [Flavobacterium subsaxonicum WB 4.1-42 = DSM 21790]
MSQKINTPLFKPENPYNKLLLKGVHYEVYTVISHLIYRITNNAHQKLNSSIKNVSVSKKQYAYTL